MLVPERALWEAWVIPHPAQAAWSTDTCDCNKCNTSGMLSLQVVRIVAQAKQVLILCA